MAEKMIKCPKCGYENDPNAADCEKCGITFEVYAALKAKPPEAPNKKPANKKPPGERMIKCPKCGASTPYLREDCINCGVIFERYYLSQGELNEEDQARLDAIAKQREEREKQEALKREQEEAELREVLRKQKEEAEKRRKEKERQEALRREREAAEREAELERQKEEEEKQRKEQERQKALQREREAAEREAELKRQKEEEEKQRKEQERQEALRREREEAEREAELKRQKEEEEKRLKEQERQEALRREQEAAEREQAKIREKEEAESQKRQKILKLFKKKSCIRDFLRKYEGQKIGVNYDHPQKIRQAELINIGEDYFSLLILERDILFSFPFSAIVCLLEGAEEDAASIPGTDLGLGLIIYVQPFGLNPFQP